MLLILAAVSIATLTGENGILTKADNAKTQHTQGGEKEQIQLAYDAAMTDNYANGNYGAGVTQEQLQAELQKYDEGIIVEPEGEDLKVTFPNGNVYTVKKDGTIEGPTKEEPPIPLKPGDTASSTVKDNYTDGNNDKATIPEGFTVSEEDNTIDTGLVVTAPDGSEFVWVPVETAIAESEDAANENKAMAVQDPDGENYRGILYDFSGTESTVKERMYNDKF